MAKRLHLFSNLKWHITWSPLSNILQISNITSMKSRFQLENKEDKKDFLFYSKYKSENKQNKSYFFSHGSSKKQWMQEIWMS